MTTQPGIDPTRTATVAAILDRHQTAEGALLPILHDVQAAFGYVPKEVLPQIARALLISDAEIHGVVTFYHDFRDHPAGRNTLKICRAEACQAIGGAQIAAEAQARLGLDWHGTTADGRVTLEPVYCLGLCACGPAAMVNGTPVGRLDETRLAEVLKELV